MYIIQAIKKDRENRKAALVANEIKFIKLVPCAKCDNNVFYTRNNGCVECAMNSVKITRDDKK